MRTEWVAPWRFVWPQRGFERFLANRFRRGTWQQHQYLDLNGMKVERLSVQTDLSSLWVNCEATNRLIEATVRVLPFEKGLDSTYQFLGRKWFNKVVVAT